MSVYLDKTNQRLIMLHEEATPSFWDDLWEKENLKKKITKTNGRRMMKRYTKKYLQPPARILEGGCGTGNTVYILQNMGYEAYGVDTANKTIERAKKAVPELKLSIQDVKKLEFPDEYFDGYWSFGVIEHFWDGYEDILKEAYRILKPGGYLFITFPHISLLRKLKIKFQKYPLSPFDNKPAGFYQFLLNDDSVIQNLKSIGFSLIEKHSLDGTKGLKDEIPTIKPILQKLYDSRTKIGKLINLVISNFFAPLSGHITLVIVKKL